MGSGDAQQSGRGSGAGRQACEMPAISRKILIGELLLNYPASAEVLFRHGFHCIGCGLSAYETLEQGCAAHGFGESEIEQIVAELKEAAAQEGEFRKRRKEVDEDGEHK
ncbi:MAG: DUF1858 domain-containing protein [Candidatus Micrarchaeota archaeon]|nr:DUF1858 domain-containing protein [Candidatus Micrarchaeota archaeon]